MARHEEFLELCAVSISGELTGEERKKLEEHLKGCASCRQALEQFKASVRAAIPGAAQETVEAGVMDHSLLVEQAEAAFFTRFDREGGFAGPEQPEITTEVRKPHEQGVEGAGWGQLWMPFAAVLLFCLTLGIASYRLGMKKGAETVGGEVQENAAQSRLEGQLSDASHEREQLLAQIADRDRSIVELRKRIQEMSATVQVKGPAIVAQNSAAAQAEEASAAKLEGLQKQLAAEEQARSQETARANELEAKATELTKQLQESAVTIAQQKRELGEKEAALGQQQELLEHDRDIRDLMGARKLYVVDVYDVATTGKTNKPYGRVFYTQGKSLIFYAYDLDQAPGLKNTSTFQAWGQRGPNREHPLNLGVFYEDNTANKRWVVKFDNPKSLAQIDAVFVTVEPDAHSTSPRGKQVLFAYLRIDPNHP